MEALFVYGTLQSAKIQQVLLGRTLDMQPATLPDYHKNTDGMYPVAHPQDGSHIDGQVLQVSTDELAKLDHYEGAAYERVRVTLEDSSKAWVYRGAAITPDDG